LAKYGYVPGGGNKMKEINFYVHDESAIPNLVKFLALPRSDGQQQVVNILPRDESTQKIMDSIKQVKNSLTLIQSISLVAFTQEFHSSTQSVPQPFYIRICSANLNVPGGQEENVQTNETLTIETTRK
jgi:predicted ATP-dependent serine protease